MRESSAVGRTPRFSAGISILLSSALPFSYEKNNPTAKYSIFGGEGMGGNWPQLSLRCRGARSRPRLARSAMRNIASALKSCREQNSLLTAGFKPTIRVLIIYNLEATMGFAPMDSGFADRSVSYFATWPYLNYRLSKTDPCLIAWLPGHIHKNIIEHYHRF